MAFIPVPDAAELVINMEYALKAMKMVFGMKKSSPIISSDLEPLSVAIVDAILSWNATYLSSSLLFTSVTINDLTIADGFTFTGDAGTSSALPFHGSDDSAPMPANVALVTTTRTGIRGRSFRGRNYWPAVPSAFVVLDNFVTTPYITHQDVRTEELAAAINGVAGWTFSVISRYHDGAAREFGVTTPIISWDTNDRLDTQRRRLP